MKRIEAAELLLYWFQKQNIDLNIIQDETFITKIFNKTNKTKLLFIIQSLLNDEVEEIRLITTKISIFFNANFFLKNFNLFESNNLLIFPVDSFNSNNLICKFF